MRVAIIDYGSGNLKSVAKAFERAVRDMGSNIHVEVTSDAQAVLSADHIVLPGVGAYADCRRGVDAVPGMVDALSETGIGHPWVGGMRDIEQLLYCLGITSISNTN